MLWIFFATLAVVVAVAVLRPLLRAGDAATPAAAFDLRVYRDQLREVDRDHERGVIAGDEAARLRAEIGRKVLDADRRLAQAQAPSGRGTLAGAALVLALLVAGAAGLYLREGAPTLPDQPLVKRFADAQALYDDRPSQAEAEANAPQRLPPLQPDPEFAQLIEQLRQVVAERPDDQQGLALLASNELRLGNVEAAREAQQRLVDLQGEQVSADELIRLATLHIEAAGGQISPEAEAMLARALQRQPDHPQARYLLGLLQWQIGRPDRTFPIWRELLQQGPESAPWIAPIRESIQDLAWYAGMPDYRPPSPDRSAGPDAADIAAAQDLSPEERQQMIQGMVSQLEDRLASQGGTPEEWAQLISALGVIGQHDRAALIWGEAQQRFAESPEALEIVREGAWRAGLRE